MAPLYHDEILSYIGKRIKMILQHNLCIIDINLCINLKKTKIYFNIKFHVCTKSYNFKKFYKFNNIHDSDNIIDLIINDIELLI